MKFEFLKIKDLSPQGWLKNQLELQANGLHGNLDKIWPDVKESKWIGGDKEGWERMPYFLDGFIPLAYLLKNQDISFVPPSVLDTLEIHNPTHQ